MRRRLLQARQDPGHVLAFGTVGQHDGELRLVERGVERAGADEGGHAGHRRVLAQGFGHGNRALLHLLEGHGVVGLHHRGDQAGVLVGQQALGDGDVKQHGQRRPRRRPRPG
jgi:hypothetical protein